MIRDWPYNPSGLPLTVRGRKPERLFHSFAERIRQMGYLRCFLYDCRQYELGRFVVRYHLALVDSDSQLLYIFRPGRPLAAFVLLEKENAVKIFTSLAAVRRVI